VKECSDLPAASAAQCGGAGQRYQKNSDGFIVYVGEGNSLSEGITKNLWMTNIPASESPFGNQITNWGLPITKFDENGAVTIDKTGNALPSYRWSMAHNFNWKRLTAYGLVDATVGKFVYNEARQWSLGDFQHRETDQLGATVETARPIGYYWRAQAPLGVGIGGLYNVLGPNNNTVEDASFARVREVTLGYRLGRIGGFGDWTASIIGRNLLTFTNYRGFDPEVGVAGGALNSGVLNATDVSGFPNLRQFTFSLATSF
jgi:hypothetical protein